MQNRPIPQRLLHLVLTAGIVWTMALTPTPLWGSDQPPTAAANTQNFGLVVVGSTGAELHTTPAGPMERYLAVGAVVTPQHRSADGRWIYVQNSEVTGWIATEQLVGFQLNRLPVDPGNEGSAPGSLVAPVSVALTTTAPVTTALIVTSPISPAITPATTSAITPTVAPTVTSDIQTGEAVTTSKAATVQAAGLNVRSGPGVRYPVQAQVRRNTSLTVLGRNAASDWLQIEWTEGASGIGWVAAQHVRLDSPVSQLPMRNAPPVPAAAPHPSVTTTLTPIGASTGTPSVAIAAPTQATAPAGLRGTLLIQTVAGGPLYRYDLASGALQQLTTGYDPEISPDGRKVAFLRAGLYTINLDGSGEQRIFAERSGLSSPKWSPDGQWIVFSRADGEYSCRSVIPGYCPSDQQLFPKPPAPGPNATPQEIAIHEQILDVRNDILNQFERQTKSEWMLARVSAEGQEYRDLAALNSARAPDWNAAGIVYQSSNGLQKTADAPDAATSLILFERNRTWHDPDWAPNGGRIVFQSQEGSHWEIYSVNPDGSGLAALTRPQTALVKALPSNVAPAWSPDGQQIVFLSNREPNHEAGRWRLWVMNADGSNQRPLPVDLPLDYHGGEQMVSWGP
jgi:hypothetical protein